MTALCRICALLLAFAVAIPAWGKSNAPAR